MKNRVGLLGLQVLILQMYLSRMLQPNMRSVENAVFDHNRPQFALAEA